METVVLPRRITGRMREVEQRNGGTPIRWLLVASLRKHAETPDPQSKVAEDLGISRGTVFTWCNRLGITVRFDRNAEAVAAS